MPKRVESSSKRKFIKKKKKDSSSTERCKKSYQDIQRGQKVPKCSFNQDIKDKKKKTARLKTQKDDLGKSQGQRKGEKEKKKIGRSYQVGNLKMQPKRRIILQDESLEI